MPSPSSNQLRAPSLPKLAGILYEEPLLNPAESSVQPVPPRVAIMNEEPIEEFEVHDGDITRVQLGETELVLIGTAHISQESVETVERVIAEEQPDIVAVELDEERFKSLREEANWEELDLLEIIKKRQLTFLLSRLALTSFQKRMGGYTGVKPGAEMAAAIDIAEERGHEVALIDRNVRTTLIRAWRSTSLWGRMEVAVLLVAGLFQKGEISEEELAELRESQTITGVLDELGEVMPQVKGVLVDERDIYMAHKLKQLDAEKVVAVVGAAHKPGMLRRLREETPEQTIAEIDTIPPKGALSKALPWVLPLIIIGLFVWGTFNADVEQLKTAALAWVLANGVLSALGAIAALAHPLTVIAAFIAAPLTSLNPTIGAGMVTALVQTFVAAPKVGDFQTIGDDISEWSGWWSNKLGRVMLVFMFSSIGSAIGTFVAAKWLIDLI